MIISLSPTISIFFAALPAPVTVLSVKTVNLDEEEEYPLGGVYFTDVDDNKDYPKEYSLKLYSENGTFFSYKNTVSDMIKSYLNIGVFISQDAVILGRNQRKNTDFVVLTGSLSDINDIIPYIIYKPNHYFNGNDRISVQICDKIIPNELQNTELTQKTEIFNSENIFCVLQNIPILILPVNNAPIWISPPIVEIEENEAYNLFDIIRVYDVDSAEYPIFVKLSVDFGTITLPYVTPFGGTGNLHFYRFYFFNVVFLYSFSLDFHYILL